MVANDPVRTEVDFLGILLASSEGQHKAAPNDDIVLTSTCLGLRGNNYANGVNSYRWTTPDHSRAINSPQFHEYNFNNLLDGAIALSCP